MAIRGRRHELPASVVGELRRHAGEGGGESRRVARLEVRFAPIAWLFGVGLAGYGVDGLSGAGVALMLPATLVFATALFGPTEPGGRRRRRKRTLRHRYLLWSDQLGRKADHREQLRRERKDVERRFLERRDRVR